MKVLTAGARCRDLGENEEEEKKKRRWTVTGRRLGFFLFSFSFRYVEGPTAEGAVIRMCMYVHRNFFLTTREVHQG